MDSSINQVQFVDKSSNEPVDESGEESSYSLQEFMYQFVIRSYKNADMNPFEVNYTAVVTSRRYQHSHPYLAPGPFRLHGHEGPVDLFIC